MRCSGTACLTAAALPEQPAVGAGIEPEALGRMREALRLPPRASSPSP